jgi:peptidyl-prolyl cis-trans isomerase SurA
MGRFDAYGDSTFAAIGDSTFALGQLADYVRTLRLSVSADQRAQLLDLADDYLNEKAVELAAYRLEERDPQFRRIMEDYEDGVLLFRISEDSVWTAAAQDSLGLRRHFEANAERYRFPERRRVVGFYSRNDSLLQVVASGLDEGLTPAELHGRFAEAGAAVQVDTVYVSQEAGSVFDRAFALNEGQRTPILPYQSRRAVLYLDGIEAPRPMRFEEARAQALADYQDALDAAFRARLRAKYDARLYPDALRFAFAGEAGAAEAAATQ